MAEWARARLKNTNRDILKASTPLERVPALRAARKELIDLLKLDPQFKDEWSDE